MTRAERDRRDSLLRDLGQGEYERGRLLFRRLASDEGLDLSPEFDAYSVANNVWAIYDVAESLVGARRDTPLEAGDPSSAHMPEFTEKVRFEVEYRVDEAGKKWCDLDLDPFPFWTSVHWYERIRGYGLVLSDEFRHELPDVVTAQLGEIEIMLFRPESGLPVLYCWVGVDGLGFVDRFSLDKPLPNLDGRRIGSARIGNVRRIVLGCAYAWSVDLRLQGSDALPGLLRMADDEARADSPVFTADGLFRTHVAEARAGGSQVIAEHWRRSHLRTGTASLEKVASAPAHWRRTVGDRWTWVEEHPVHGSVQQTVELLSRRTTVADAIGMGFWKLDA